MGLDLTHFSPTVQNTGEFIDYFDLNDLSYSPEYVNRHARFISEKDFGEFGKTDVIYFESKGHQRSGMKDAFYMDFNNDKLYFDLKSVIKAYQYLQGTRMNTLVELQENFQKNFIDNFVEGESIFHVSW